MTHSLRKPGKVELLARSLPDPHLIDDPRVLAWEILRRRSDYRGAAAYVRQIESAAASITLITARETMPSGGLRFRRVARARGRRRQLVLGLQTRSFHSPRGGAELFAA